MYPMANCKSTVCIFYFGLERPLRELAFDAALRGAKINAYLARAFVSHRRKLLETRVAHALMRAVSRLVSTLCPEYSAALRITATGYEQ